MQKCAHVKAFATVSTRRAPFRLALALLLASQPDFGRAMTQDDAALDELVVTARRLPELVGGLPLAIDVFTTNDLQSAGIDGLAALGAHAPGLNIETLLGASSGNITLRGQSQSNNSDNVAVFVDGVYQANRSAIDIELLDIERIEVIRGPQNTLFGHSAFAGALQYISRAPTREPALGVSLESGSDRWFGAQAFASGPLGPPRWLGRFAVSYRSADGTLADESTGQSLGGFSRRAVVATVARDAVELQDWALSLSLRHTSSAADHPAIAALTGTDYNCGGRDPASGLWSYFCGRVPITRSFDISDDLPESTSQVTQLALRIAVPLGRLRLEFDSSMYRGHARVMRDFDVSNAGQPLGVCTTNGSCLGSSVQPALLDRVVNVNQVLSQRPSASEFLQELRLRSQSGTTFDWLAGVVYFETRERRLTGIGAARGGLAANEQLVALLPGSPLAVGPLSRLNRALVDDPMINQVDQVRSYEQRRTFAAYIALDWQLRDALRLRAELRHTRERLSVDSVTANFLPSFGTAFPAQQFHDATPRVSADYKWSSSLHTYLSAAKGSRSGGINGIPGLVAEEQTFAPETNWTYEAGFRFLTSGVLRALRANGYYIDWRDTQLAGFATTPGITNLITRNTGGRLTRGIELSLALQPAAWLRGEFAYSYVDASFRRGSDDPGSGAFCGLAANNSTSTFCTLGPPRNATTNSAALVPWLDGNEPGRVPRTGWHSALVFTPRAALNDWRLSFRTDLSHQDDMYERDIEAFSYGERTLLDVRLTASRGPWTLELWGRNLTDDRYMRSSTSRQAQFYPTSPRPMDLVYADVRRIGLTVRYNN
jgi:iron complex outermembrane receptor protein